LKIYLAGDIVASDQDGVVIVAPRTAPAVAAGLKAVLAKERKMEANVKAGIMVPGWLKEAYKNKGVRYLD
jgi:regulator of RNase E activity RraA